jgi:hypothetical protein
MKNFHAPLVAVSVMLVAAACGSNLTGGSSSPGATVGNVATTSSGSYVATGAANAAAAG